MGGITMCCVVADDYREPNGSPSESSSVQRLETTVPTLGLTVQSAAMHGHHQTERDAIIRALLADTERRWTKRTLKLADCCSTPQIGLTAAGTPAAVWFRCRDRLCPLCAASRSGQVTDRIMSATANADALRFITFTVKSSDAPLREQLDRLTERYKALRKTDAWKRHVRGAIATVEVTFNRQTGQFHPHLHVIADGSYWDQKSIAYTWQIVTGDSCVVDIRAVRGRNNAAKYIAKYAAKPGDIASWPTDQINEYAAAIHRRRMLIATGSMHNSTADLDGDREIVRVVGDRIPLHAVERRANTGCYRAALLLTALANQSAQYQSSLAKRRPGQGVRLAAYGDAVRCNVAEIYDDLLRLWQEDGVSFIMGGSGKWDDPPKLKRMTGRGKIRNHTPAIGDWCKPDTRHR